MSFEAGGTGRLRVVLVDADHRVRECLSDLINLGDGIEVVGTAGTASAALELVERARPHLVVVDPQLPDLEAGLALVARLHEAFPTVRVVVMGWADALALDAVRSGADGTLDKTAQPDDLVAQIAAMAAEAR
jgi:DNA-binding NarL/FixJ family response regulator